MEIIVALALAAPLGYFARTRSAGRASYLLVWLVVLVIQTIVVHNDDTIDWMYPVVNTVILAAGLALNTLGARAWGWRGFRLLDTHVDPRIASDEIAVHPRREAS
jgi:hypothetical protein